MSVAFVREESAEAAQEITLPERPISPHPNLVTQSGLKALESATAESGEALKAAQGIEDCERASARIGARGAGRPLFLRAAGERDPSARAGKRRNGRLRASCDDPARWPAPPDVLDCRARMKPILVPERFPMSHRSRAASSASASATSSTWTATRSRSSKSREAAERHRGETDGAPLS